MPPSFLILLINVLFLIYLVPQCLLIFSFVYLKLCVYKIFAYSMVYFFISFVTKNLVLDNNLSHPK